MINKIVYKYITSKFLDGCSDYNSLEVRRSCRSKKQGRDMFKKGNIPHAKGEIFFSPYTAYKFVKKHGFPVCVKPNVGGYSRGSYFPINNWSELWKGIILAKIWWPTTVIEEYLLGKNYRIVVTKGSIDIVMQRFPPFVIGDQKKDIRSLVNTENKIRKNMNLLPIIHEIQEAPKIIKHLKKLGLNFDSIPEKDKKIELFHRVSLSTGGVLENVKLDSITAKNKELFIKILNLFKSNIFGLDVIMEKGISIDYDKQKTIFLEVNSRPYLKMHQYPRYGNKPNMSKMYEKLNSLEIKENNIF